MHKVLKEYLREKYLKRFQYLVSINGDKPLPPQTIYSVLEPLIEELVVEAKIRPYRELLDRFKKEFLDYYQINYKELKYNNFYSFLKKKGIIKKAENKIKNEIQKETFPKELKPKRTNSLLIKDPVDSLKEF